MLQKYKKSYEMLVHLNNSGAFPPICLFTSKETVSVLVTRPVYQHAQLCFN